jgi:hypothetical protein
MDIGITQDPDQTSISVFIHLEFIILIASLTKLSVSSLGIKTSSLIKNFFKKNSIFGLNQILEILGLKSFSIKD